MIELKTIKKISKNEYLKYFLLKSFSLEMLIILYENEHVESIDRLYLSLHSFVPKMPAFLNYLSFLEQKQCILKLINEEKNSSRKVVLNEKCKSELTILLNH